MDYNEKVTIQGKKLPKLLENSYTYIEGKKYKLEGIILKETGIEANYKLVI